MRKKIPMTNCPLTVDVLSLDEHTPLSATPDVSSRLSCSCSESVLSWASLLAEAAMAEEVRIIRSRDFVSR